MILEMPDVETPNRRATSANGIPNSLTSCCAIVERPCGIFPLRLPIFSSLSSTFPF